MSVSIRAVILARDRAQNFRWISGSNDVWRHIPCYNASCTDDRILADNNLGQNCRSRANRSTPLHQGCLDSPVLLSLKASFGCRSARIRIVDECNSMTDKDVIFNRHTFADKAMA